MKKLILTFGILWSCLLGLAIASTVSTQDGQNFLVTNDAGVSANYTMSQFNSLVNAKQVTVSSDIQTLQQEQQTLLFDTEAVVIANQTMGQIQNAYATGMTNAACSGNTTCWSGTCSNSVCQ